MGFYMSPESFRPSFLLVYPAREGSGMMHFHSCVGRLEPWEAFVGVCLAPPGPALCLILEGELGFGAETKIGSQKSVPRKTQED